MGVSGDNQFEVKLGRIRSPSGERRVQGFFKKMARGAGRVSRSRRGGGGRQRQAARGHFQRRVIVKVHVVRMDAKGFSAQRHHMDYVERDGTGPKGEPSKLYDRDELEADKDTFLERGSDDRHQFRIIISPEDAGELKDLTALTSDLVDQMENDLGTKLDWVAVNHYDTGQPHTHLIISGKRDGGADLVIPRDYIAYGIRERVQELVEIELGPVPEIDGRNRIARMVGQERFTQIDHTIFKAAREGVIDLTGPSRPGSSWRNQLARMRLKKLVSMGLAEPAGKGRWTLVSDADATLRRMGERGDIIKTMHRAMEGKDAGRVMDASSIFDPGSDSAKQVVGVIIDKGIADDVNDRAYVVIDSLDGKPVYVTIGGEARLPEFAKGQIVTVTPPNKEPRSSDYTIAKIAGANDGRYSAILHMGADKTARPEFVAAHIRRLEAMHRVGHVQRQQDATWDIPKDYLEHATAYEVATAARRPADISLTSGLRLSQMKTAIGATWLDEHLRDFDDADGARGFASDVETARAVRRNFLMKQGFLEKGQHRLSQDILDALETRDLESAGAELSSTMGKAYSPSPGRGRIEGIYANSIDCPSGKYAVIERVKDFSLVPWREMLERNRGKSVSGLIRGGSVSWRLTKGRGIS